MISCFIYSYPIVFSAVVFLEQTQHGKEPVKRLLLSTLALILFACQAATDTLPPQSPQATTTTSVPVAEVATLPLLQTSPPDPTNLPFQASDPTPFHQISPLQPDLHHG